MLTGAWFNNMMTSLKLNFGEKAFYGFNGSLFLLQELTSPLAQGDDEYSVIFALFLALTGFFLFMRLLPCSLIPFLPVAAL